MGAAQVHSLVNAPLSSVNTASGEATYALSASGRTPSAAAHTGFAVQLPIRWARRLGLSGSKWRTTTRGNPGVAGSAPNSSCDAVMPPAEAPIPTIGPAMPCCRSGPSPTSNSARTCAIPRAAAGGVGFPHHVAYERTCHRGRGPACRVALSPFAAPSWRREQETGRESPRLPTGRKTTISPAFRARAYRPVRR